jgi:hypothetical protein
LAQNANGHLVWKVFRVAATKAAFAGLDKLAMTDLEWKWLENFLDILAVCSFPLFLILRLTQAPFIICQIPHAVQQVMSGELHPLLSGVIAAFVSCYLDGST